MESFLVLASHRSYVVILLPSVVRLRYFYHRVRKFSEIVKIESSLRGGATCRGKASHPRRALLLFSGIQLRLMSSGDVSDVRTVRETCAMCESAATAFSINFQFSNAELVIAPDLFARQLDGQLSPYFVLLPPYPVVPVSRVARCIVPLSKNR